MLTPSSPPPSPPLLSSSSPFSSSSPHQQQHHNTSRNTNNNKRITTTAAAGSSSSERRTSPQTRTTENSSSCAMYYDQPQEESYSYTNTDEDSVGMQVTSGKCVVQRNAKGLIGISVGGGAPHCPCVYIAHIVEKSPTAIEGSLQVGDELVAVNGTKCKGASRQEVVRLIRSTTSPTTVTLFFNKLHVDVEQGKTFDIVLKKIKHRLVETIIDEDTADALGLSRAIIANDVLANKIIHLEELEQFYADLVGYVTAIMKDTVLFGQTQRRIGQLFTEIAVRGQVDGGGGSSESRAAQAFQQFAHVHTKLLSKHNMQFVRDCRPAFMHMCTILHAALPDMKASLKKYLDAKFEYLSFCLKTKEMEEEEKEVYDDMYESLYRVASGNYEYRLTLRCRDDARRRFNGLRRDITQKMELLEGVHNKKLAQSLACFVHAQKQCNEQCAQAAEQLEGLFPIESDVPYNVFRYASDVLTTPEADDEILLQHELHQITTNADLTTAATSDTVEKADGERIQDQSDETLVCLNMD